MPGPGGGSHGGGGRSGGGGFGGGGHHGGGGFGGGHRPGGFGGPRPGGFGHHPHHPPMGGWHWHGPRRHYGGGGGCLGGLISAILAPIILLIFMIAFVTSCVAGNVHVEYGDGHFYGSVGEDLYDEALLQDFADGQYAEAFADVDTYEDNVLLVFLTEEDRSGYTWIAWVGDHIQTDINWMLGNEETFLGEALSQCINEADYKYSLDSNLADVVRLLTKEVQGMGLESSFNCGEMRAEYDSHLVNKTALPLTDATVNDALSAFTDATGIPMVIVVEEFDDVFGDVTVEDSGAQEPQTNVEEKPEGEKTNWMLVIGIGLLVVIAVVAIVQNRKKKEQEWQDDPSRYRDFDDQYK